ncbi:MAG: hypothetical protein H7Z12_06855 [Rhodospirillaceae bacterium]|nr:hypothetical protein [Rhodospirillales bacterium]
MTVVRHFRQILLWPLQLMPVAGREQIQRHWEQLGQADTPWFAVEDEFTGDPALFQPRHYSEFVTFLPSVQRFLYGEGGDGGGGYGGSPIRVFRRNDVRRVRACFKDQFDPVELSIAHVDLYFFYDIDVVILNVEVHADGLELAVAQELLFRFGRSYPASWDEDGQGGNCLAKVEWLDGDGRVLAASDYTDQAKYLKSVCCEHAAGISADWEFLLAPMVPHASSRPGALRFRQLEYDRMPIMAYVAVDDPMALSRGDFVRLALATRSGPSEALPFSADFLAEFERQFCYDRYWGVGDAANTRFLCSGHAFVMVGDAGKAFFTDHENGLLGQFRHQYFQLGLIAHFHKAALLMFGDRLGSAVSRLDIRDAESVKRFKRVIRQTFEIFLRFTHRCWFHEVSVQAQAKALFAMWQGHLGTVQLYDSLRREVQDMAQYLDSDGLRRQANTVVRLTVVTTFGLIATITTGALGMNLLAAADDPLALRVVWFLVALGATLGLTLYTLMVSKRLSDMLEVLSDERLPLKAKLRAFANAWRLRVSPGAKPPSGSRPPAGH